MEKTTNPHFVYQQTFTMIENDLFEINNAFDIYSLQKDKNTIYLCGPNELERRILEIFEFKVNRFKRNYH